jgi:preprotein translocase subunit SecE
VTDTRPARSSRGAQGRGGRTTPGLFFRQVVAELRKVIYPTQQQLVTYFSVVLVFVLVLMALVSAMDYGFNKAMFKIFG